MGRIWLPALCLAALAPLAARGDAAHVAVLSHDDPDGGALLEAELGKYPGVSLVERTEIDRIFREQALGAVSAASGIAAGKLLHADALVIVSRGNATDSPLETARLVAVQPGVVIDSAVLAPDRSILSAEVSRIAAQFEPLLGKAGALNPSAAVKVSLLGLHFELNSPAASGTERTLNTLLANRLTHRPRIVVLERWNLNAAAWEKDLSSGDPAPFWTGSCLIDGRLVAQGSQIAVEMRLRPPSGPPISISVNGPSNRIAELADTLADRVAAALNAPEAAFSWDRKEEALNETLLAHWALGNRLYLDAFEAASTADALCPHTPDIDLLRLECETQLSFPRPPFVDTRTWTPYEAGRDGIPEVPTQLDAAQTALDHLRVLWAMASDDPTYQPAATRIRIQAIYTVQQASRLLSAVWAQDSWRGDEAGFSELRQKLRDMAGLFLQQDAAYQVRFGARLFVFAPYWFETPADTLAFYQRIARLPSGPAFPSPLAYGPSRWIGSRPWLVGWRGEKQPELATTWQSFLDSMQASSSPQDQIAGLVWRIQSAPYSQRAALLPGLANFAWNHRADITRTDSPLDLSPVGEALASHGWQGPDKDDPSIRQVSTDFLPYLFQSGAWIRPRTLHAFGLVTTQIATKEDVAKIAAQFAAYRTAMTGSPFWTASAGYDLDRVSRDVFGSAPVDTAKGVEALHFSARFESLAGNDGQAANVRDPVAADGHVWLIDNRLHRILGWDPLSNDQIFVSYPQVLVNHFPSDLAAGSRYLFVQSEGQVWEYDRSAQIWTHLDLPPARYSPATTSGHAALLSWEPTGEKEGGGLLSVDPATHAVETVLSGRSNPPRNELDGKPDSRGLSLHLTEDGRMDYVVKLSNSNESMGLRTWGDCHDDFYTQRQPGGPWKRVLSVVSTFVRVCHLSWYPTPHGALLLTRFHLGTTALSSFGQLIAWDRDSGKLSLLLSNPATDRPPLPDVAQWEMPPDLACTEAMPHVWVVPALRNGVLWVLRWEGLEKQGMQRAAVYRFRPGIPHGERLALDFDPTLGIPDGNKRTARFLRPENVAVSDGGFVLDRSPEMGVWYLSFSEMGTALDASPVLPPPLQSTPTPP